jgi:Sulfotransferase family
LSRVGQRRYFVMSKPLFIFATPRSLTSMTCAMIGNHPDMIGLAETNLFAADTYAELERIYLIDQRFQHGLLRSIAELGLGGQTEENIEQARLWLEGSGSVNTADLFKDLMAMAEPKHVIDTSILYVYGSGAISRITQSFPDAYYLHLAMHPRLTCESIYKTRKVAEVSHLGRQARTGMVLEPETMWLNPHMRILDALEGLLPNQKMFLRGEVLLSDPMPYLIQIAEWLEIRTDQEAIEAMTRPEESPFAKYGPENAQLGNDPNFLENPGLRPIEEQDMDLDSPVSWDESMFFNETLKQLARSFGY